MEPRIAATADDRFVLAWEREVYKSDGWLEDIYYAVRGTSGGAVEGVTKFTAGVAGGDAYRVPGLASLDGNRALLAYEGPNGIAYAVVDSAGNMVRAETPTGAWGAAPDAVQLPDGSVLVAWTGSVGFAVVDGTTYEKTFGPTWLYNPAAFTGDGHVSVAADEAGHAILTWMDSGFRYGRNLYYALVDSSGTVLTNPMIFRTSQATATGIATGYGGYGNTSYGLVTPTTDAVDAWVTSSLVGAAPGGIAAIPAAIGNYGSTPATSLVLTATLDSSLSTIDASPVPVSASADTLVWNLSDIGFLGSGRVVLSTEVPSTTIGTRYPVTWTVASTGPEADASNNTATAVVMISRQVFLPLVFRGY